MPLLVKIAPDLSDDDVLAVADLALRLRAGRHHRHQHHDLPRRPAHGPPTGSRTSEPAGSPARRSTERSLDVLRLLRGRVGAGPHAWSGSAASPAWPTPAPGSTPAPTLLQGYTAFVYEGPLWPSRLVAGPRDVRPVHVTGELLSTKRVGAYRHLTLVAPGIPERFRPGTFVAVAVGGDVAPTHLARRAFWIHRVKPVGGYGATIELVVEPPGSAAPGWPGWPRAPASR